MLDVEAWGVAAQVRISIRSTKMTLKGAGAESTKQINTRASGRGFRCRRT